MSTAPLPPANADNHQPQTRVAPTNAYLPFARTEIEQSIPARFEKQAALYPTRLALKTQSQALTYQTLNQTANRLARAILAQTDSSQEPVAVLLGQEASAVVAIMAILKAGKFYVPFDPALPQERINYILADTQAKLIITDNKNLPSAHNLPPAEPGQPSRRTLNLDALEPDLPDDNLNLPIPPNAYAYLLYTSGSTGLPKGVAHPHCNVLHKVRNHTNGYHISADDRLLLLTSFSFGASTSTIFMALLNGAAIYPYNLKTRGLADLAGWLAMEEITVYQSVATTFRSFTATLPAAAAFPKLRLIRLGGETIRREDVELFKKYFEANCLLRVGFGTTETNNVCSYFVDKNTQISDTVPVGYPVEDKEILILDPAHKPLAPGETGEIAVRSQYLAPGYWHRPELTRAKFLPDPDGGDRRIYLTGDLGRLRPDGCLEHLGRKDFQVKIRGNRVELGEVEQALRGLDGIKEAVVTAQTGPAGDTRLVAYLVVGQQPAPAGDTLRPALAAALPDYMVPAHFIFLDELPHTPGGKVDRQALPPSLWERPALSKPLVAPRTDAEKTLAKLWGQILGLAQIGIHDSFFELGGNSLQAMQLFVKIEAEFGRNLPLATLFQAPTIEQLADVLSQENWTPPWRSLVAIQPFGSKSPFYCVHAIGGHVLGYRDLARYLGTDQPFYGLQAIGLNEEEESHTKIEEMAAHYLAEIQSLQPAGPYYLGGFSSGAKIAFEIAQQLHQQGQQVAVLALIDAGARFKTIQSQVNLFQRARLHFRNLGLLNFGQKRDYLQFYLQKKMTTTKTTLRNNWREWKNKRRPGHRGAISHQMHHALFLRGLYHDYPKLGLAIPKGSQHVRIVHQVAMKFYVPQLYPGRITLFLNDQNNQKLYFDYNLGWERLANGGVEIYPVPGNHLNLLNEPHVQILADKLRICLDQAQGLQPTKNTLP